MNSIIESVLKSRFDPRGHVVVLYNRPPRRQKKGVVYIYYYLSDDAIIERLRGYKISKVFYTDNGTNFTQLKIAP